MNLAYPYRNARTDWEVVKGLLRTFLWALGFGSILLIAMAMDGELLEAKTRKLDKTADYTASLKIESPASLTIRGIELKPVISKTPQVTIAVPVTRLVKLMKRGKN